MNNDSLKISVCISFFNNSHFIKDTLKSIQNQNYSNWEIVLYNDGSTENELTTLMQIIRDLNIPVKIINSKNVGRLLSRVKLYQNCSGDVIVTLDSDDYFIDDHAFEKIIYEFSNKNVDCVLFNCTRNNKLENYIDYSKLAINDGVVDTSSLKKQFCIGDQVSSLCLKAINSKNINTKKFPLEQNIHIGEDRLLFAYILDSINKASLIDEPLYFYRENSSSIMHSSFDLDVFFGRLYVESIVSDFSKKWNILNYSCASYSFHYIVYNAILNISMSKLNTLDKINKIKEMKKSKYLTELNSRSITYRSLFERLLGKLFFSDKYRLLLMFVNVKNVVSKRIKHV